MLSATSGELQCCRASSQPLSCCLPATARTALAFQSPWRCIDNTCCLHTLHCHVTYLLLCLQHLHCLCCIGQVNGCRVLSPPHHQTCLLDSSSLQLLEALLLLMHKLLLCCRPTLSGVHPVPPFMSLPARGHQFKTSNLQILLGHCLL